MPASVFSISPAMRDELDPEPKPSVQTTTQACSGIAVTLLPAAISWMSRTGTFVARYGPIVVDGMRSTP